MRPIAAHIVRWMQITCLILAVQAPATLADEERALPPPGGGLMSLKFPAYLDARYWLDATYGFQGRLALHVAKSGKPTDADAAVYEYFLSEKDLGQLRKTLEAGGLKFHYEAPRLKGMNPTLVVVDRRTKPVHWSLKGEALAVFLEAPIAGTSSGLRPWLMTFHQDEPLAAPARQKVTLKLENVSVMLEALYPPARGDWSQPKL